MPTVQLTYYECDNQLLPPVCAVCGVPAADGVRFLIPTAMAFVSIGVLTICCPPLLVIVVSILEHQRNMTVPMCEYHRNSWRRFDRAAGITYLVFVCGSFVTAIVALVFFGDLEWIWLAVATGYWCVAMTWLVIVSLVQTRYVRTTQATPRGIRLSAVHADFVQAIRDERARNPGRIAAYGDDRDDYDDEV